MKIIEERWRASVNRSVVLKARIQRERAKTNALIEVYQAGECSDTALHDRIATNIAWFESVVRNYNAAIDDHQQGKVLTDIPLLQSKIRQIEQKQLAVEVALQQGSDCEVGDSEQDATIGDKDKEETEILPADKLFRMADVSMERIELDVLDQRFLKLEKAGEGRQNTPAVGWFSV